MTLGGDEWWVKQLVCPTPAGAYITGAEGRSRCPPLGKKRNSLVNYVADPPPAVLRAAKLHLERVEGHET